MRFCQDHWDRLREAIEARGIGDLIADDADQLMRRMKLEIEQEKDTLANFDPLMSAHWAIVNNVMATVERGGGSALYLMAGSDVPEDPVEGYGEAGEGRTWPRCPLCYLNLGHELTCTEKGCSLDRERGYDMWIDRAADDVKAIADKLRKAG